MPYVIRKHYIYAIWTRLVLNQQRPAYEAGALPIELQVLKPSLRRLRYIKTLKYKRLQDVP